MLPAGDRRGTLRDDLAVIGIDDAPPCQTVTRWSSTSRSRPGGSSSARPDTGLRGAGSALFSLHGT
ncbi:hypothetical protein DP939_28405 [Spongiactinospora rosea]|uniref:Uncharacterized protein n=1 Tax=Spongiactinospora rosea TaxID=2248750 RepID=A0A366LRR8_9ACTN|nr:hypothetical protein DP939_28405 [Spongiactinospora rosea]